MVDLYIYLLLSTVDWCVISDKTIELSTCHIDHPSLSISLSVPKIVQALQLTKYSVWCLGNPPLTRPYLRNKGSLYYLTTRHLTQCQIPQWIFHLHPSPTVTPATLIWTPISNKKLNGTHSTYGISLHKSLRLDNTDTFQKFLEWQKDQPEFSSPESPVSDIDKSYDYSNFDHLEPNTFDMPTRISSPWAQAPLEYMAPVTNSLSPPFHTISETSTIYSEDQSKQQSQQPRSTPTTTTSTPPNSGPQLPKIGRPRTVTTSDTEAGSKAPTQAVSPLKPTLVKPSHQLTTTPETKKSKPRGPARLPRSPKTIHRPNRRWKQRTNSQKHRAGSALRNASQSLRAGFEIQHHDGWDWDREGGAQR